MRTQNSGCYLKLLLTRTLSRVFPLQYKPKNFTELHYVDTAFEKSQQRKKTGNILFRLSMNTRDGCKRFSLVYTVCGSCTCGNILPCLFSKEIQLMLQWTLLVGLFIWKITHNKKIIIHQVWRWQSNGTFSSSTQYYGVTHETIFCQIYRIYEKPWEGT